MAFMSIANVAQYWEWAGQVTPAPTVIKNLVLLESDKSGSFDPGLLSQLAAKTLDLKPVLRRLGPHLIACYTALLDRCREFQGPDGVIVLETSKTTTGYELYPISVLAGKFEASVKRLMDSGSQQTFQRLIEGRNFYGYCIGCRNLLTFYCTERGWHDRQLAQYFNDPDETLLTHLTQWGIGLPFTKLAGLCQRCYHSHSCQQCGAPMPMNFRQDWWTSIITEAQCVPCATNALSSLARPVMKKSAARDRVRRVVISDMLI